MLGTRQIWAMFLISFVDVAVTAVILEVPNFLYNWALDKYLQRRKNKNKNKTWQHRASLVFCVFCFSPVIILGEMEQKPLISYPQIFLKFLLYFMIDVMKKKIVFLNKTFFAFFHFFQERAN